MTSPPRACVSTRRLEGRVVVVLHGRPGRRVRGRSHGARSPGGQGTTVMAEARARGYDTKVMRKVIALRKRDKDDIAEEEAVLEMYKEALGMA